MVLDSTIVISWCNIGPNIFADSLWWLFYEYHDISITKVPPQADLHGKVRDETLSLEVYTLTFYLSVETEPPRANVA